MDHPDRHSGASEDEKKEHERKFKEVGEAYGVLSDTKKRSRYDNGHDVDDLEGHGHGGFNADIDPNQIFQAFFGGGGGGPGMHGASFHFGGPGVPGVVEEAACLGVVNFSSLDRLKNLVKRIL